MKKTVLAAFLMPWYILKGAVSNLPNSILTALMTAAITSVAVDTIEHIRTPGRITDFLIENQQVLRNWLDHAEVEQSDSGQASSDKPDGSNQDGIVDLRGPYLGIDETGNLMLYGDQELTQPLFPPQKNRDGNFY